MSETLTTPRPFSSEWRDADEVRVATPFGEITLQPLGWGIRAHTDYESRLRVNGGNVQLSWADFHETAPGIWTCESLTTGLHGPLSDATPKQRAKLAEVLPDIVAEWAAANRDEVDRRARAYHSDRARTCEETIRTLEDALAEYRRRLPLIEAGDTSLSPYLNGGRGIMA